ncbi:hydroxymethylglutaryl-CoA synthase [Bifidobacterium bohemicum]|uniref:Hydroxymethylglutaryl-CoA synthase n=1 Tax=Bifidobacterium bohemicum DSM 22767 TaxID=1437606 RepID=A0A086ZGX9_9BIFI|nr:hydroxymethylglutaryl-CoA synthase [Bifidobacterium bohemicum]KFI45779.1 hydroxymethylglutaryl-CoA synthase [Bifidobacterium bohemicum DSM 22767]SCC11281.1 hydroxymethylglutaryl-CoA synthase [Bifidobacterium bohemicum]
MQEKSHAVDTVVGIDRINFTVPNHYLDLTDLAESRGVDPNKYLIGIGQSKMAVPALDQDIVAMAANAAEPMLSDDDKERIGLLVVATESGVDQSKAASLFVGDLLGLPGHHRSIEIKEACYGATAGLQLACDYVARHPQRTALVIASDIARYGLSTPGEVTQGAGAVAMLVTRDPAILAIEPESVYESRSTGDFWRPNYSAQAFARGKYSEEVYVGMFQELWAGAQELGMARPDELQALLFHIPFSKMGRKGLRTLGDGVIGETDYARLTDRFESSIIYGRQVGNVYTGSVYLALLSLLDNDEGLTEGDRIGLFSYGSGSVAELYFGILQPGYRGRLDAAAHRTMLQARERLSVPEYEAMFSAQLPTDGSELVLDRSDQSDSAPHYLAGIKGHERQYR